MAAAVNNNTSVNASSVYGDIDIYITNITNVKGRGRGAGAQVNNTTDVNASSQYGDVNVDVRNETRIDQRGEGRRGAKFPHEKKHDHPWPETHGRGHGHGWPERGGGCWERRGDGPRFGFLRHEYGGRPWA